MNLANKITIARVIMIPVFLIFLMTGLLSYPINRYVAAAIFVIASLTDFLDGYIARSRNLVTNFGKFLDPLADKLLVAAALIALVELKDIPSWAVIIIISREFIITGFRLIAVEAGIVIAAGWWGKVKTATQMIMVIFVLLNIPGTWAEIISSALIILSVFFTVVSGAEYLYKNRGVLKS